MGRAGPGGLGRHGVWPGGVAVQLPDSGFAHLAGLLLVPLAVTTMLMAIPAETYVEPASRPASTGRGST